MTEEGLQQLRHTWEAKATHQELRARHELEDRFVRRFQVEGTAIGNSRLLRRCDAVASQSAHGGAIVEVLPLLSAAVRHATPMPACPVCEVEAGKPCKSSTGKQRVPHPKRWRVFHGVEDAEVKP